MDCDGFEMISDDALSRAVSRAGIRKVAFLSVSGRTKCIVEGGQRALELSSELKGFLCAPCKRPMIFKF